MEKVKRTPASLKKMVETFGMEILHRGSDYDSAVITMPGWVAIRRTSSAPV